MKISFELTMPNVGSWNGKWTGEGKKYYVVRSYSSKEAQRLSFMIAESGKETRSFFYNFGDGWSASIKMQIVDASEARKRTKVSAGFYGYEWMIDSIIREGKITTENTKRLTS